MCANEAILGDTSFFRAFPDPEEAFAEDVERHSEFLLPLATVSLRHLSPEWEGWLPFVMPIEPGPGWGIVGERSLEHHSYLCQPNWIGYRVVDGKLAFAGDWLFFHRAYYQSHPPSEPLWVQEQSELEAHYLEQRAAYETRKAFFRRHGRLTYSCEEEDAGDEASSLVDDLGGVKCDGNWTATDFPLSRSRPPEPTAEEAAEQARMLADMQTLFSAGTGMSVEPYGEPDIVAPLTEDGREFAYVGTLYMNTYGGGDAGLILFYDPRDKLAITTFDWS